MLRRRLLAMLAVVLLVVLVLGGYKAWSMYQMIQQFSAPKPPVAVGAAQSHMQTWDERLPAVGSLKALQGIDVALEVTGTVTAVQFESGQKVRQGQPLLQLDGSVEAAQLATAQSDLGLAQVDFNRGAQLVGSQAISRSEYDRLAAQLAKNKATVAQLKATLDKKRILAPFDGTIGIRQVDVGAYLAAGTKVATLQDLSSLYVDFNLPEQSVPRLAVGQPVRVSVAAWPGEVFTGKLSAIDPRVNDNTRNVLIRATLPNADGRLLPGMFADVQVVRPDQPAQVVVPETAVTYTLYGNSVYLIKEKPDEKSSDNKPMLVVERVFVDTGERRDGLVAIRKGLEAGQSVVTAGQLKLSNGSHVTIAPDNTGATDAAHAPKSDAQ